MAKNWSAAHNFEIITMLVSDWRNKTMFNDWTSSDTNKLSLLLVWLPNTLLVINEFWRFLGTSCCGNILTFASDIR